MSWRKSIFFQARYYTSVCLVLCDQRHFIDHHLQDRHLIKVKVRCEGMFGVQWKTWGWSLVSSLCGALISALHTCQETNFSFHLPRKLKSWSWKERLTWGTHLYGIWRHCAVVPLGPPCQETSYPNPLLSLMGVQSVSWPIVCFLAEEECSCDHSSHSSTHWVTRGSGGTGSIPCAVRACLWDLRRCALTSDL